MKIANCCSAVILSLCCLSTQAVPVTVGALSSNDDGSTEIITDNLNNLQWLRWNVLANLSYAQTLAEIAVGGGHEGWSIAHNAEAQMFINALFYGGTHTCNTADALSGVCGNIGQNITPLLGDNYFTNFQDIAYFLNDGPGSQQAGILQVSEGNFDVAEGDNWTSIASTDYWSQQGGGFATPITWLLYRSAAVPEPLTTVLLVFGLLVLASMRCKRVVVCD